MPCTVINTKQINSCKSDGLGSAIKSQGAEEFLIIQLFLVLIQNPLVVKQKQLNSTDVTEESKLQACPKN